MMKLFFFLFIFIQDISAIDFSYFINQQNCDQIIDKKVFIICYDYEMKGAKYVAYRLDGNLVNKKNIKKRLRFYTEKTIPKKYRSHPKDYVHSEYDRGHLANDASFDYDKKILRKTYSMANVIPQIPYINRKLWAKVEKLERKVAYQLGQVFVVNGVVYEKNPKRIGKNKIAVPFAFWKMIYHPKKNYQKCFYYLNDIKNINIKEDHLKDHLIDCNLLLKGSKK